ncbi:MAG: peptidase, partial [Rhodocyclales bacterium]|nr:peptidase [Rhodocyclales bacterium]
MKVSNLIHIAFSFGLVGVLGLQGCATSNFDLPLGFSVRKMDRSAEPSKDFNRFAAGRWLDAAWIPSGNVRISGMVVLGDKVSRQLHALNEEASQKSAGATKGSPLQQVGDFYASGMDEKRLIELGITPLEPLFDRIAASGDRKTFAETLARLELMTDDPVLIGVGIFTDLKDTKRNAIYVVDAELGMNADNYLQPEAQPIRDAYRKMVIDFFVLTGSQPAEAQTTANAIIAIETRVAARKLSSVQKQDPNKTFVTMSFADLKSLLSNVDLETYFGALGLPIDSQITVRDVEALRERNAMLAEYPASDTQAYLRWELLRHASSYLSPAFIEPTIAFNQIVYGNTDTQPREFR